MRRINVLDLHRYAPELNKLHVYRGEKEGVQLLATIPIPNLLSLQAYRVRLFRLDSSFIFATVTTHYEAPNQKWLERKYSGSVLTRKEALDFKRKIINTLAPGGTAKLTTRLIG